MHTDAFILLGVFLGSLIALGLLALIIGRLCCYYHRSKTQQQTRFELFASRQTEFVYKCFLLTILVELSEVCSDQHASFEISRELTNDYGLSSRLPSVYTQTCKQNFLAHEFIQLYLAKLHKAYLNPTSDRCYCSICSPNLSDHRCKAGYTYAIPKNWYRIGLNVDKALAEGQNIWAEWATSYHGTSLDRVISIIHHRQLLIPGDTANNSKPVGIVHGTKTPYYYTTPSVKYASLETYSRSVLFNSCITDESYKVNIIIQLKQKPKSFRIQRGTIRYYFPPNPPACDIIEHEELEWFSNARSSTVPYGLLIKFELIPPTILPRRTISSQNSCQSSRRSTITTTKSIISTSTSHSRLPSGAIHDSRRRTFV